MTVQFDGAATDPANRPPNTRVRPQHIADQLMSLERSLGSLPDKE